MQKQVVRFRPVSRFTQEIAQLVRKFELYGPSLEPSDDSLPQFEPPFVSNTQVGDEISDSVASAFDA